MWSSKPVTQVVYVAISKAGYVAPYVGMSLLRKDLVADYLERVGRTPQDDGYRVVRAAITYTRP